MNLNRVAKKIFGLIWPAGQRHGQSALSRVRGTVDHVIILDGTMSSLKPGRETNAGLAYRLLSEIGAPVAVYYEAGVQWQDWRNTHHVLMGYGVNRHIKRAYGYLASRYKPGDRIFFLGYSRGAYAVRSLAGVIDQVGLLRGECATERNVEQAYRHYRLGTESAVVRAFAAAHCHEETGIEMVGVWDTVKALGLRLPLFWRLTEARHQFHSHALGPSIRHGFHALALDETRSVFDPVLWECPDDWEGRVEQLWFPGTHGDVGGQLDGDESARPLANISLVWMLERAEDCGLLLPEGWRKRYDCDATAPSIGTWRGWGKLFLLRGRRRVGRGVCERLHESVGARAVATGRLSAHRQ